MKTLDEVIKAFECCEHGEPYSNCKECSYIGIGACCLERENDALYYLKEYRSEKAMREADRKGYLDWIEQYKEVREKHQQAVIELKKNPPLTWDELKGMEGKPVWIELLNHDMWDDPSHRVDSEWWVIGEVRKDDIILATYLDEMELFEDDLGEIWQAYRKERNDRL